MYLSHFQPLTDFRPCTFPFPAHNICKQPAITHISHQGSDITVSWANTGAASYYVALLNKGTATDEELAALQVSTTDTAYTFHNMDTCKFYAAYVQAQCDANSASDWATSYYVAQPTSTLQWEPITLNFHATGDDAIANGKAYPGVHIPCLLYRLTLPEAQTVYGYTMVDGYYSDMMLAPLKDDTLDMTQVRMLNGDTAQLAVGDYGIVAGVMPGYEYEVFIAKADTLQFTPITLPYLSDTITNDYYAWNQIGSEDLFRGFEFTLNEATAIDIRMQGLSRDDHNSRLVLFRYVSGQNDYISSFVCKTIALDSGTYRIGAFAYENVPYQLSITDVMPSSAFDTITADTVLTGTISAADGLYPSPYGTELPSKAYTFTLESEQLMTALLYATPSDSVIVTFYTDSLLTEYDEIMEAAGMNDSTFYTCVRNRNNTPQRYYMVVYNLTEQEQSFTCALHTCSDPDSVPASDTMRVAEPKMITLDAHSKGIFDSNKSTTRTYDAYTIHLEKDKQYRFYAEAPATVSAATVSEMNICVLDPARKEGSLFRNSIIWDYMISNYHTAIETAYIDEEKDYTLLLNAIVPLKMNDEPKYLLAFEEMLAFDSLILGAQEVVLPFRQDTAFGKVKYAGNDSWNWHPIYDYFSNYGIYSAAAYSVQVNAGDTLYASLATDYDAVIHFFHFYGAFSATDTNPLVIDSYEGYPQIAEKGMYVNQSDSVESIVVVASDNNYRPGGNRYRLVLSRSLSDIVEKTAIAEASQSAIYCEQDMSIVRDILSRLTLTAKDESGVVIATIDNHALYWDIDFAAGIATYEVNQADLIPGYIFRQTHISVSLRTPEVVFPMADKSSIGLTEFTESAAREALSKLVLTAVDANGNTVHTFTNVAADWIIDITTGLATYTLRNEDLPEQYKFDETTVAISVQLLSTAVDSVEGANTLLVYPNPASDYTFVAGATDEICIYDLAGRLVLSQAAETGKTMLNITALPAGVYSVQSAGQTTLLIVK